MELVLKIDDRALTAQAYALAKSQGLGNAHSHARSNVMSPKILALTQHRLQSKWSLCQDIHLYPNRFGVTTKPKDHLRWLIERMLAQDVRFLRTSVDVGDVFGTTYLDAALELKEEYRDRICFQIEAYYLDSEKLLASEKERARLEVYCHDADVLAGLPGKAAGQEREYIQMMLDISSRAGNLPLDLQTDQDNEPDERETIILAEEVLARPEFIGKVSATHAISLSCLSDGELDECLPVIKEAGISIVITPIADISMLQNRTLEAPIHNSIAPLAKLLEHGINVCYGTDNIRDIYNPENEGIVLIEMIFLFALARQYGIKTTADIFSTNVQKAMGLC